MNAVMPIDCLPQARAPGDPLRKVIRPSQSVNAGVYLAVAGLCLLMVWAWLAVASWGGVGQLFLIAALASLLYGAWRWLEVRCISYRIDEQRIVWSAGVFSKTTGSLEIFRIQNITLHQGIFERIFSAGTLVLQTQDPTNPMVRVLGVSRPEALREALTEYVQQLRRARGMQEVFVN